MVLGGGEKKLGPQSRDKSEKGFEKGCFASSERTMSSDEDTGTCQCHLQRLPCWRVVARASREVRPRREEPGSDEGAEEGTNAA